MLSHPRGRHAVFVVCLLLAVTGGLPVTTAATVSPTASTTPVPTAIAPTQSDRSGTPADPPPPTDSDGQSNRSTENASIVSVLPNPVATGDTGEFVVVRTTRETTLTLVDGETRVEAVVPGGTVALSSSPMAARTLTGYPVVDVSGLALANSGERISIERDGRLLDTVVYEDAPEGERLVLDGETRAWRPVGYEPRPVVEAGGAQVTAFVLPDETRLTFETLRAADDRILLAGYTFSSPRVTRLLVAAAERGVRVRVLVDDAPVGGTTNQQARALDRLAAGGVEVRVVGGERARFSYHHPKYAVVDGTALVLTENWKASGVGGNSSRGWGVRVDSPTLATELATLFASDMAGRDVTSWTRFRRGRGFTESDPRPTATYPTRHEPARIHVDSVRLLTAPGNAESAMVRDIDEAQRRLDVVQVSLERDHPFVTAAFDAARRGVEVRLLLSGAWYVREENEATVAWLNRRAEREGLPLRARVATPGERFEKVHAKGVVADDTAFVGSLNWNRHSSRENREVVVALESEAAADYYRGVFDDDWQGNRGAGGLVWVAAIAVVAAVVLAWRGLEFDGVEKGDGPWRRW